MFKPEIHDCQLLVVRDSSLSGKVNIFVSVVAKHEGEVASG
jgi:hypothetical protein